jgi:hypothetical protein
MVSKVERFWIAFILRFAIGFLCLFAALPQFDYGAEKFAADLSRSFSNSWVADLQVGVGEYSRSGIFLVEKFLFSLPFIFCGLSVFILTGLFLRPALRLGALLFVCLGLGKYLQSSNNLAGTAYDFLFALIICIGLYFLSLDTKKARGEVRQPNG